MVALPDVTDPVMPGEVVGTGPPLPLIVVPVVPVAAVGEPPLVAPAGVALPTGDALPVGEAWGGGPSDWSSWPPPPHATSSRTAQALAIMSFRRNAFPSRSAVG